MGILSTDSSSSGPESSEGESSSSLLDTEPASEPELPKPKPTKPTTWRGHPRKPCVIKENTYTKYGGAGIQPGDSALCAENHLQDRIESSHSIRP